MAVAWTVEQIQAPLDPDCWKLQKLRSQTVKVWLQKYKQNLIESCHKFWGILQVQVILLKNLQKLFTTDGHFFAHKITCVGNPEDWFFNSKEYTLFLFYYIFMNKFFWELPVLLFLTPYYPIYLQIDISEFYPPYHPLYHL